MKNLEAILQSGGASLGDVFETRVYLRNLEHLGIVDEVFGDMFHRDRLPVRTAIEVSRLNEDYESGWLPNHDIEIQCTAFKE